MRQPFLPCLTLRHPWVFAILRLGKPIENRAWRPSESLQRPGELFGIHGGAIPRGRALDEAVDDLRSLQARGLAPGSLRVEETFIAGIAAVFRFAGTVEESDDPWFAGPVGWLLADQVTLPSPVACKGARGLWRPDAIVVAAVRDR
jgi:hypothetical protein